MEKYSDYKQKYLEIKGQYGGGIDKNLVGKNLVDKNLVGKNLVIHISGPSGSGKTTMGKKLEKRFGNNILIKDIDDLRAEFIKEYYGKKEWSVIDKDAYQKFIDAFVKKQKKPIIFVGLNNMPWWHKDVYYNMHSNHNFYIDIDSKIVLKQKCARYLKDFGNITKDEMAMNDLENNNSRFVNMVKRGFDNECNEKKTLKMNNKWNRDYKKQGYNILPRNELYKEVSKIISNYVRV
jgi:adenylate kinase family enzyme